MKKQSPAYSPLKNSTVWSELKAYFIQVFENLPPDQNLIYTLSREQLVIDLKKHFKKKYDPDELANLLKNGFQNSPGVYLFKFQDFKTPPSGPYDN
jgi:hypothetical protein